MARSSSPFLYPYYVGVTRPQSALVSLALLSTLGVLGFACNDDKGTPTSTTRSDGSTSTSAALTTTTGAPARKIVIAVVDGRVTGGARREQVKIGELVDITVTSDKADELHVHGYDITADLTAGTAGSASFTADIPGVFEVELEKSGLKVLELEVR